MKVFTNLSWVLSGKKMAMIFEFDIDFRYDLRSPDFIIEEQGEKKYRLKMPHCFFCTVVEIPISFMSSFKLKL